MVAGSVYLYLSAMSFSGALLSVQEKKNLAALGNVSFVVGSYCPPVSQTQAGAEWKQAPLLLHTQLLYIFISSCWLCRTLRVAFVMQRMDHNCPIPSS